MELTNDQIREILPHRYPFLMVDRITECVPGSHAVGIKCVCANEMHFLGHFPQKSVMPGVLIIEALAQTGAIALLTEPENKGKLAMFAGIKNAKFRHQVTPGDVLELECKLTRRRGAIGLGEATAKVGEKIVCTTEISFAIIEATL